MNKKKLARKMLSQEEIKDHTPIFQSKEWIKMREARALKEQRKAVKAVAVAQQEEKPIIKRPTIWQRIKRWIIKKVWGK